MESQNNSSERSIPGWTKEEDIKVGDPLSETDIEFERLKSEGNDMLKTTLILDPQSRLPPSVAFMRATQAANTYH